MSTTLSTVHDSLVELKELLNSTEGEEKKGLEAFIECVAPQLVEGATVTYLGKIASIVQADSFDSITNLEEALTALEEHFEVTLEPAH